MLKRVFTPEQPLMWHSIRTKTPKGSYAVVYDPNHSRCPMIDIRGVDLVGCLYKTSLVRAGLWRPDEERAEVSLRSHMDDKH